MLKQAEACKRWCCINRASHFKPTIHFTVITFTYRANRQLYKSHLSEYIRCYALSPELRQSPPNPYYCCTLPAFLSDSDGCYPSRQGSESGPVAGELLSFQLGTYSTERSKHEHEYSFLPLVYRQRWVICKDVDLTLALRPCPTQLYQKGELLPSNAVDRETCTLSHPDVFARKGHRRYTGYRFQSIFTLE